MSNTSLFMPKTESFLTSICRFIYSCIEYFPFQESLKGLLNMRRDAKEKELEALLAGEQDSCSCYIEVVVIDI